MGRQRVGAACVHEESDVHQVRTTPHGRAIGEALGNPQPDPTTLAAISRGADVLLQFGDHETQFGIQAEPLAVFERQRGSLRVVTTFSHEADAERYLLVLARPAIVPEPWDAARVRYAWPDDVDVDEVKRTVTWEADDGTHRISVVDLAERKNLCLTVWARNVPIVDLLTELLRFEGEIGSAQRRGNSP